MGLRATRGSLTERYLRRECIQTRTHTRWRVNSKIILLRAHGNITAAYYAGSQQRTVNTKHLHTITLDIDDSDEDDDSDGDDDDSAPPPRLQLRFYKPLFNMLQINK